MEAGMPPKSVTTLLRIDGLAVFLAALVSFQLIGGNWWLFALLILVPDLSMLGLLAGERTGVRIYNLVHSYLGPFLLAGAGLVPGIAWAVPAALIWAAHIGIDRALGYGLKYPGAMNHTHLGAIGKAKARRTA